jgi:hypothetical protein
MNVKCVLCALGVPFDPEDSWVGIAAGSPDTSIIYIVNGQSVCGKHVDVPYTYPEHGLGGMQARAARARAWNPDASPDRQVH